MSTQPLSVRALPVALKVLFTAFLLIIGGAYLMSLFYMFLVEVDPHRKMGMGTVEGVIHKYYGQRDTTKLESSLRGSMSEYVTPAERDEISEWIRGGATQERFAKVAPIISRNCLSCHSPDAGVPPMLTTFEEVGEVVKMDLGESVRQLAQVSHVHLFGMAFIFLLTGTIFCLCELREWVKVVVVATPFVAMVLDIGSWWLTHYQTVFAYTVIAGGALMSLVIPIQVFLPIYQMWFKRPPRIIA